MLEFTGNVSVVRSSVVPVEEEDDKGQCGDEEEDKDPKAGVLAHRLAQLLVSLANRLGAGNGGTVQRDQIRVLLEDILREGLLQAGNLRQLLADLSVC